MASATRQTTLLQAIADDHQLMYNIYDAYVSNTGNLKEQTKWSNQLLWEVARHATAEELIVYPLFEKHLGPDGKQRADHDRSDHQQVKNMLTQLENLNAGSDEHATLLKTVIDTLRPHNTSEEQDDIPALEQAMGAEASISTANKFRRTKHFVPTRPHPSAPNKPPFETVAGLLAAPMDKLKDLFETFPSEQEVESVVPGAGMQN
ncbi:HHE domain-containing protein [Panaeolus papilionaceus]|nr:HHE domain-containing protein [Panaeolus papilionaceus]